MNFIWIELYWKWIILFTLLTNFSIYLYSCINYSTVHSPAVLFSHKFNWTQQHSVCTKNNDRFTNFPFTVIILFVLFVLICELLLPVVCVFQFDACIWYSFCPVLFCHHRKTVNSWTELNHCTFIMVRIICIPTDCVSIKLSAVPHILCEH